MTTSMMKKISVSRAISSPSVTYTIHSPFQMTFRGEYGELSYFIIIQSPRVWTGSNRHRLLNCLSGTPMSFILTQPMWFVKVLFYRQVTRVCFLFNVSSINKITAIGSGDIRKQTHLQKLRKRLGRGPRMIPHPALSDDIAGEEVQPRNDCLYGC